MFELLMGSTINWLLVNFPLFSFEKKRHDTNQFSRRIEEFFYFQFSLRKNLQQMLSFL